MLTSDEILKAAKGWVEIYGGRLWKTDNPEIVLVSVGSSAVFIEFGESRMRLFHPSDYAPKIDFWAHFINHDFKHYEPVRQLLTQLEDVTDVREEVKELSAEFARLSRRVFDLKKAGVELNLRGKSGGDG